MKRGEEELSRLQKREVKLKAWEEPGRKSERLERNISVISDKLEWLKNQEGELGEREERLEE
ncbi:MAG: hypothetical protein ABWK01_01400 [Infirmifilum sp.]